MLAVALDRSAADVREYVEAAAPRFPCLVDEHHVVADLYGIVNVPTGIWIDEVGRIVRPNEAAFATDRFIDFHGIPSAPYLEALRAWVREGRAPLDPERTRDRLPRPTWQQQLARATFVLACSLHARGRPDAAERHFAAAGKLAPHDWTIRRGSMPIRGIDPMGPEFVALYQEWLETGKPLYPKPD